VISAKNKRKLESFDDLLEACEACMLALQAKMMKAKDPITFTGPDAQQIAINKARAAIAKAKGVEVA